MHSSRHVLDRAGIALAWASGLFLVAVVVGIILWLGIKGISSINWDFLWQDPSPGSLEKGVLGGIRGPLVGTLIVMTIGTLIALPLGVGTAIFLAEYRKPAWLANVVESAIEIIFGVPSVVFALFGLAIFTSPWLGFLSSTVESSGQAFGRSYLVAGIMLSLLALPPITRSTEEAIHAIPNSLREASYALGKGQLATIRRIVLPGARPGLTTGVLLGLGKIAGDTAIIWLLLGGTITFTNGWLHPQNWGTTLRGTGATLTSYIYFASPVGEGNNEGAAYGAAFVLMILMIIVNLAVIVLGRRGAWKR